jgi:hypothetical protein
LKQVRIRKRGLQDRQRLLFFCDHNAAMMKNEIPTEVRRFMLTTIPTVPHMEALMLARASAPGRWSALTLSQRLYITPVNADEVLADLHNAGLLLYDAATSAYFYQFRPSARCDIVEQLAALYASNLVEMTVLIHSKMDRKAQQFADAFVLRKDSKDV